MELTSAVRTHDVEPNIKATVYGARKLHSLFRQDVPDEQKAGELDELMGKVYSHVKVDGPSELFWQDLRECPPASEIPQESLYAYLDSECTSYIKADGRLRSLLQPKRTPGTGGILSLASR